MRARLGSEGMQVGERIERLEIGDAWVVDPWEGREGRASVRVEGGRVAALDWHDRPPAGTGEPGSGPAGPPWRRGLLVVPGLFDLHAHFREPGGDDAETIASGLAAAGHGGFTDVCLMPNTEPPVDSAGGVERAVAAARASLSPVAAHVYGTISQGRRGERLSPMAELAGAGALGFSDDGSPVADPELFRNALGYAAGLGRIVVEHPEDPALTRGAEANEGLTATILGLRGWPAAAETGAVARALAILAEVAREMPADLVPRLHLTHLSAAGSVEAVRRAKTLGLSVTCDVTPHHLALHDGWLAGDRRFAWATPGTAWPGESAEADPYDPATRVNPPLRSPSDAVALAAGLRDGTIDAIATDHAPHREVDKAVEFGDAANGISGIETALGVLMEAVDAGVLDLMTVVRALTVGPRAVLGPALPRERSGGSWKKGVAADLVVVDAADRWRVTSESLMSKGRNTPLLGRELAGRVLLTAASGRLAYADAALLGD